MSEDPNAKDPYSVDLGHEIDEYVKHIRGLASTFPFLIAISHGAQRKARENHKRFLEANAEPGEDEDGKFYKVPIAHVPRNNKFRNLVADVEHGQKVLPKTFLVSLVSQYDFYLGRLIQWMLFECPSILDSSEKKMSFGDLRGFSDLRAVEDYMVEKEVESVLRKSHADQFSWLENKLGCTLREELDVWPRFIEVCERRNLFVHTDGIVSSQYLRVCNEHRFKLPEQISVGEKLDVDPEYFASSVSALIEIGFKLGHVVWRRIAPDDLEKADNSLIRTTYELIENEKYELAECLLRFAVNMKKFSSDGNRRIFIVNLAQTYKWLGKSEECEALLDRDDWTAASAQFKICIDVLRDDFEGAVATMRKIGSGGDIAAADYRRWPVFKEFRKSEQFKTVFQDQFGHEEYEKIFGEAAAETTEDDDSANKELDALFKSFDLDEYVAAIRNRAAKIEGNDG